MVLSVSSSSLREDEEEININMDEERNIKI
jgi:hypothetical protein